MVLIRNGESHHPLLETMDNVIKFHSWNYQYSELHLPSILSVEDIYKVMKETFITVNQYTTAALLIWMLNQLSGYNVNGRLRIVFSFKKSSTETTKWPWQPFLASPPNAWHAVLISLHDSKSSALWKDGFSLSPSSLKKQICFKVLFAVTARWTWPFNKHLVSFQKQPLLALLFR